MDALGANLLAHNQHFLLETGTVGRVCAPLTKQLCGHFKQLGRVAAVDAWHWSFPELS